MDLTRRQFLKTTAAAGAAVAAGGLIDSPPAVAADGASWLDQARELAASRWWWSGLPIELPRETWTPHPFASKIPDPVRVAVRGQKYLVHWFRAAVLCGTWWPQTDRETVHGRLYGNDAQRFLAVLTTPSPHHLLWCGMVTTYKLAVREPGKPIREERECHPRWEADHTADCASFEYTDCCLATRHSTIPLGRIHIPTAWLDEAPLPLDGGHSPMGWLAQVAVRIKQNKPVPARWLVRHVGRICKELDELEAEYRRPSLGFAMYKDPGAVTRQAFGQDLLLYGGALVSAGGPRLVRALERQHHSHADRIVAAWEAGLAAQRG